MVKWLSFITVLLGLYTTARSQVRNYTKRPAVGIHMLVYNFEGADSVRWKTGLAVSFQNEFAYRWMYGAAVEGAFVDLAGKSGGKKDLLVQGDLFVRWKILKPGSLFEPFLQAGVGGSKFDVYVSAGPGIQVNVSENLFMLANAQYRVPVTSNLSRQFCFSIGLAGPIYRKRVVGKPKVVALPTIVAPAPVPALDSDGDGLVDSVDACPAVAGEARRNGCPGPIVPVNKDSIQSQLNLAAQNIYFKTGSYELLSESFPALETVLSILTAHAGWRLSIEGHTDNVGKPAANRSLSEHRAHAVLDYLQQKGIPGRRLQSAGYGAERPVAENSTPEGRAKNRRVELKLLF